MISTLLHLLRLFPFLCGGARHLALENLALRQQLAVYQRTASRPKLHRSAPEMTGECWGILGNLEAWAARTFPRI